MGQSNNNPFKEGGDLMAEYHIDHKMPEQSITLLTHKKTKKEYLLREQTYNDLRDFALNSEKMKNRKNITNPHLTNLIRIEERSEDHLCSNFYKIYTLWQYPHKSLEDQINERALMKKRFESTELWSILACSIMGLATLQQQQIKHECLTPKAIVTDEQGNVKIVDPLARGLLPNIDCIYNNRSVKHIYLSPEQCESIETQKPIINKNPYRNDVFVLGMILLQCGLLQRQDQCYLNDCSEVNFDKIQANLNKFGQVYEEQLRKMIQLMLNRDIRNRPDWTDLLKHVSRNSKTNRDMNPKVQNRTTQRHFITRVLATQSDAKKVENQLHSTKLVAAQPPKSLFYKDQQQILQPATYVPLINQNTNENKVKNGPLSFTISQHTNANGAAPPSFISKGPQFSYKPIYTQNYIAPTQQANPFAITFSNPQQFQSSTSAPSYFLPPLPQTNIQPQPQYSSNMTNNSFNMFIPPTPILPKIEENKQSIASNLTGIIDQRLQFSNNNQFIRPAESFNYQINNFQNIQNQQKRPVFASYAIDPRLTKTPELGDHSELQILPSFVEQHFKMGSRYEGYKLNGQRHGKGKFFYQDGGSYDGEWKENKMDGYGTLYYQSFEKAYEGNWRNDQFQGFGKLYNQHPSPLNQNFDYTNFDEIDEYWVSYEGDFHEDLKSGKGKLKFSNGQIFEGTFKDDMVQGQGTFYCRNGLRVQGIWHENYLTEIIKQQYLNRQ